MIFKNILKFVAKLAISLVFVLWLVFKIKWHEVLVYVSMLAWWQIFLYLGIVVLGILISARKWQILLESKELSFSIKDLFALYLTGTFINNFMPSTIGGDTYRTYGVGKKGEYAKGAATVVVDRITGLLALMALTLFFGVVNFTEILKHPLLIFLLVAIFSGLVGIFLLEKSHKAFFWKKIISIIPPKGKEFIKILHEYYLHKKLFIICVNFSMLFALVGVALANYILFLVLGVKIGALNYLSVIFLISIISAFPISINNIGIKEWAYVTMFGFFGVSASAVVAVALISRFFQMLLSFFALPFYLKNKK